jgi:hypothetical protein
MRLTQNVACLKDNPDIIKMPNQVELSRLEYVDFNEPTRTLVRQYLLLRLKEL